MSASADGGGRAISSRSDSDHVRQTLRAPDVHEMWARGYDSSLNDRFFDRVFDVCLERVAPPPDALFVDVGCGPGVHTIRLARRGFRVHAVDFSEAALELAAEQVQAAGLSHRVTLAQEDLLQLSFSDGELDYALCWGVLMHVPAVARAVDELSRALAPGGVLIVSEGNMHSLEIATLRALRQLGRNRAAGDRKEMGLERWATTTAGPLMTRRADVGWLVNSFARNGVQLEQRLPGQFTEVYAKTRSKRLQYVAHAFNTLWFNRVRDARLASGNILIFRKG